MFSSLQVPDAAGDTPVALAMRKKNRPGAPGIRGHPRPRIDRRNREATLESPNARVWFGMCFPFG